MIQFDWNKLDINTITDAEIEWIFENFDASDLEPQKKGKKRRTITVDGRKILNDSDARNGILGLLNKKRQLERQQLFHDRVAAGTDRDKIRIVTEGDSWFNYPTKLKDVVDYLFDDFSIFSLCYGGDWLSNIYEEREYLTALRLYKPQVFLISGGGNDLVGNKRMSREVLKKYKKGAGMQDLIKHAVFESILKDFEVLYRRIFSETLNEFPDLQIICHGYDYPYFDGKENKWFGVPFRKMNINDIGLRNEIGTYLIDRFNTQMEAIAADFANVHYLDNVGAVPRNLWLNELHPNQAGFKIVADRFKRKIEEVAGPQLLA